MRGRKKKRGNAGERRRCHFGPAIWDEERWVDYERATYGIQIWIAITAPAEPIPNAELALRRMMTPWRYGARYEARRTNGWGFCLRGRGNKGINGQKRKQGEMTRKGKIKKNEERGMRKGMED